MAATLCFAAAPAAAPAQSPSGPDAAPGASSGGPSPDPAPSAARKPVVRRTTIPPAHVAAPTQSQSAPASSASPSATATTPAKPAVRRAATHHRKKPAAHKRRTKPAPATKHHAVVDPPSLPRLIPAQLVAQHSGNDDGRARKLAAGALSLLLLALASAMLLAVTARVERRKVVR
ncbi:MAG TPA: hypothetical protein VH834_12720 [Solirubrobacteraceae bacterium]